MKVDAEKDGVARLSTGDKDNRITPIGKFIRKCRIDELPQLFNILLGQMSIVGPRPTSELGAKNHYVGKYDKVLTVLPGLACLDSLYDYAHGELFVENNEEFYKNVAPVRDYLANMYVERQSIRLDLYCIFRTLLLIFQIAVLKRREFPYTKFEAEAERMVSRKLHGKCKE